MLYIGTSGYMYRHWGDGVFYPEDILKSELLSYYSQFFNSVELNSPFYHLPTEKAYSGWYEKTPKDFLFVIKVSRYISHIKQLKDCAEAWDNFYKRAKLLKEKIGSFLIQLPPKFKKDLRTLEDFIKILNIISSNNRFAFEFRHQSWFDEEIYKFFRESKNLCFCQADSPRYPSHSEIAGDFIYIRLHGSERLYGSKYSDEELNEWAKKIKIYLKDNFDVFVYFNNDAYGYAVENAKMLKKLLE